MESAASPGELTASPIPSLTELERRVQSLEAGSDYTVNVLSLLPVDDYRSALTLDADFDAIEAAGAARSVCLRMFGGVYPLTRLVSGARAEFAGPVYQAEGASWYSLVTVEPTGAAVEAVRVGGGGYSVPQGGIPKTDLAQAVQQSLDRADTALQNSFGAANSGKFLVVDANGRATTLALAEYTPRAEGYGYGT